MPVYITQGLYLSGELKFGDIDENNPRIGYDNLLVDGSIVADHEDPLYPASNIRNVSTASYWRSTEDTATQYLTIQVQLGKVNYFGVAGHNLAGAELKVQSRDDPSDPWVDVTDSVISATNHAIMWMFEEKSTTSYWRLEIEPNTGTAPRISNIHLGEVLPLQRSLGNGHVPAIDADDITTESNISQSSQYLGERETLALLDINVAQQHVGPSYYRSYIRPFKEALKSRNVFFLAWRPAQYPDEVVFGWCTDRNRLRQQIMSPNGNVRFDIIGNALAPVR